MYRPTYCNKYGAIALSFQQARISYINHHVCHVHLAAVSVVNLHYNVSASSKYRNLTIPTDRDGGEQVIRSSKSYEIQTYQPVNLIVSRCSSLFSSNFMLLSLIHRPGHHGVVLLLLYYTTNSNSNNAAA